MRLDHLLSKEKSFDLYCLFLSVLNGGIAQLARAPALQAGGQEFDSLCLHHDNYNNSCHTLRVH